MEVAEQRSFTRAAKRLGLSPAALSQTIRGLEERLGVRLLNRTTRSVGPTEAGEQLLLRLRPVVDDYAAALESLNQFRDKPAGLLRLTVAPPGVPMLAESVLGDFLAQYPDIRLEISVDSSNVDIVAQQFDAGIRPGHLVERDMVALRITGDWQVGVVGTPAYFARHGEPRSPQDLHAHNCIRVRLTTGALMPWRFMKDGKTFDVAVNGSLVLNEVSLIQAALLKGVGLAQLHRAFTAAAIAHGQLKPVLEDWQPPGAPFCLYYSSQRRTPAALQALIDFLRRDQKKRTWRWTSQTKAQARGVGS
jgi:DNA-binding transcriptional LysR family regulator